MTQPALTPQRSRSATARRCFTVDEANRSLVYIGPIVRDAVAAHESAKSLRLKLEMMEDGQPRSRMQMELAALMERQRDLRRELDRAGVSLADVASGLVDFPSWDRGRAIELCWRLGESEIRYFHEIGAGYAARQPIARLESAATGAGAAGGASSTAASSAKPNAAGEPGGEAHHSRTS